MNIRELSDDNTNYSTTRYGFVTILRFDIIMIILTFVAFLVCHLIGKPLDDNIFKSLALILGIPTALITTSKSLQGFEPNKDKPHRETKKDKEVDESKLQ